MDRLFTIEGVAGEIRLGAASITSRDRDGPVPAKWCGTATRKDLDP